MNKGQLVHFVSSCLILSMICIEVFRKYIRRTTGKINVAIPQVSVALAGQPTGQLPLPRALLRNLSNGVPHNRPCHRSMDTAKERQLLYSSFDKEPFFHHISLKSFI